jgi:trehalose 6-phosphate phosphatase
MVGIDGMVYIGNHGLERLVKGHPEFPQNVQQYLTVVKSVIKELTQLLSIEGITIENKGVTATIHYRLCREPQLAEKEIMSAIKASPQASSLRIIKERMAIDLLPPIKMDKGTAVLDLIQEYNLQAGIYVGDDATDIDAFRAIHTAGRNFNFHGFAIGIISPEMPENLVAEVDFTLNGINDIERFLRWLSQQALQPS